METGFSKWKWGVSFMFSVVVGLAAIIAQKAALGKAFWLLIGVALFIALLSIGGMLYDLKKRKGIANLIGEWTVTKPGLIQKWTFSPTGTVISDKGATITKGTWRLEKSCVHIEWDDSHSPHQQALLGHIRKTT